MWQKLMMATVKVEGSSSVIFIVVHDVLDACVDPSCMFAANREANRVSIEKSIVPSMT